MFLLFLAGLCASRLVSKCVGIRRFDLQAAEMPLFYALGWACSYSFLSVANVVCV